MEKRFIVAFVLSMLIVLGYPKFLKWIYPPQPTSQIEMQASREPSLATSEKEAPAWAAAVENVVRISPEEQALQVNYEDKTYQALLSPRGGALRDWSILGSKHEEIKGNRFLSADLARENAFSIRTFESGVWAEGLWTIENKSPEKINFAYQTKGGLSYSKSLVIYPQDYGITLKVKVRNDSDHEQAVSYELSSPIHIGGLTGHDASTVKAVYLAQGEKTNKAAGKIKKESYIQNGAIDWVASEIKYITLIVQPKVETEYVRSLADDDTLVHYIKPKEIFLAPGETTTQEYFIYAGPKSLEELKKFDQGFEKILYTKFLGGFWLIFLGMMQWFYKMFHNYGVSIILVSAVVKLVFTPLTHMSFDSMRRMQALQPKMKSLQEQHKNDPQKLNKEMMELYKKHKVNPLGGCLPMVLQMPIFIALYHTFLYSIELRGAPFIWWITDLSEPDRLFTLPWSLPLLGDGINILPLIMIGTMIWQQKLTPQTVGSPEQQKMMTYMPILFGFIFYKLPSGLVIYWIVNNVLTIVHQIFMKKFHIGPEAVK